MISVVIVADGTHRIMTHDRDAGPLTPQLVTPLVIRDKL